MGSRVQQTTDALKKGPHMFNMRVSDNAEPTENLEEQVPRLLLVILRFTPSLLLFAKMSLP